MPPLMACERVLVIDDSPTILKVVQLVLTKAGFDVATAADGDAGLALAHEKKPALILADEPTGSLDSRNAELVSQLLIDLQSLHGHALVLVTHDAGLASRCTQQIRLSDGRIVESAS